MKRIACLCCLLLCGALSYGAELQRGPYTESPTDRSAIVRWRTDVSTVSWLEYGPDPKCDVFTTISPAVKEHALALYGLTPATTICYSLFIPATDSTGTVRAAEGAFQTLASRDAENFSFIVLGDSTGSGEDKEALISQMEGLPVSFVIHTGDLVESGLDADADAEFFTPFQNVLADAPFFFALGNHEYGRLKGAKEGRLFLRKNFLTHHRMPWSEGTPHYYFFDTGTARFVFMDAASLDGIKAAPPLTKDSPQYKWLENVLSKNRPMWKFAVTHYPFYSSGGHGSTPGLAELMAPMFEADRVDIVFQGHDHDYERTAPITAGAPSDKGPVYLTLGGGGSPLYIKTTQNEWSTKFISAYSFAYVEVAGRKVSVTIYGKDGEALDAFELTK